MIYAGKLKKNTATTVLLGQLFSFADSKTLLVDELGGNANFDPTALICTLSQGTSQSILSLTKTDGDNDMNLTSDGNATLDLTAANTNTAEKLVITFTNATEGSEILFPCSFWFEVLPAAVWDSQFDAKTIRCMSAWLFGKWQDKTGVSGTYEVLDPEDDVTVIMEVTPKTTSPQRTVTIKI